MQTKSYGLKTGIAIPTPIFLKRRLSPREPTLGTSSLEEQSPRTGLTDLKGCQEESLCLVLGEPQGHNQAPMSGCSVKPIFAQNSDNGMGASQS